MPKSGTPTPSPAITPKVLKIGGDGPPKVLKIGGDPTPPPKKEQENKVEAGSKVTASKAVGTSAATGSGKSSPGPTAAERAAQQAAERREADAVAKEQEDEVDDSVIAELYGKVCSPINDAFSKTGANFPS